MLVEEKVISCGIIIRNEFNEILMCHVTNGSNFDFPKGILESNESRIECAIRETFEETGLRINKNYLFDLGEFEYITTKSISLFLLDVKNKDIDLNSLKCTSYFVDIDKQSKPEVDNYRWIEHKDVINKVNNSMKNTIINNKKLMFLFLF